MEKADKSGEARPYLTLVGWTRNDGYTPDYTERTRHAVGVLLRQLERHEIPSELLVVEWNPPADRPLMSDLLGPLGVLRHVTVRFVEVDRHYHERYRGWQQRGLPTVEALNVGIRRGRGRFLAPRPLDVFYSEALVRQIARRDFEDDCVYRCDRSDVRIGDDGWLGASDDKLFSLLETAPVQRHRRLEQSRYWKIRDLHTNGCGDFTLLSTDRWRQIRGYPKDGTVLGLDADSIALHAAVAHGAREVCLADACTVYKVVHGNLHAQRVTQEWKPWQRRLEKYLVDRGKHQLAHSLRKRLDYPRRRVRGIDSLLGPSIERNFVARAERFAQGDLSVPTNDADWGWGSAVFREKVLSRAGWDTDLAVGEGLPFRP